LRPWLFRLKAIFTKAEMDREFEGELQEHLDLLVEEFESRGLPRPEATSETIADDV
jgi:hypothetical protein